MTPALAPRPRLALWIGFWVLAATATHLPPPADSGPAPPMLDKVVHFGMYATLALLGGWRMFGAGQFARRRLLLWFGIYLAYAGIDETTQAWVGRTPSWGDFIADLIGVASATAWLWLRRRAREAR